ncbi:O-antigen ligase family protein [Winogradskyella sp.]|jgi:O-antigen ligase|uniref:O-antigen ligase family protein n=1 Tax=Winogradskyella sp. TaxID=1883156 RepID=UPI0025EECAB8|nr:O-antigen ligase family protein [Winogradskyella sp.]MCT4628546.1 O-antigen ligase family protein [Winogradskyella sp.]
MTGLILSYSYYNYFFFNTHVNAIEVTFNKDVTKKGLPIMYISESKQSKLDYSKVFRFNRLRDSVYIVSFEDPIILRKFRLYFEYPNEQVTISNFTIITDKQKHILAVEKLNKSEHLKQIIKRDKLKLEIHKSNAYIEASKSMLYTSDFKAIYLLLIPLVIIAFILAKIKFWVSFKIRDLHELSIVFLLTSIFLPPPIYNIALILAVILSVKNFKVSILLANKNNILVVVFFFIYLFNNLFVSQEGYASMRTIERFLPFLILPIALHRVSNRKLLNFLPSSAIVIGFGFLITSIYDVYVYKNIEFLSFENYTKYLHPVYFSYLLFFSICYIDAYMKGWLKYIIEFILFVFLIFSGSKMVFVFSLLVVLIGLLKNKKTIFVAIPLILITLLFSPLKRRFKDILNKEDLTILKEEHIENENDPRINGLTLRLILWKEALATMSGIDYIIGKGVTKQTDMLLEKRIFNLGLLEHKSFNPHNQYVDTFWRTGIIGLILLILIPAYSFIIGLKNKNKLLVQFSLFMFAVMWSESVFGRVNGIYFFTTVLLILMNSNTINENSHIRD